MEQLLGDAKRLVQRLSNHDNSVDILISEATNLQNKLIAMRQYRDEVSKLNDIADHRPRSTLILGSQLENQRIQNLEQENRELSISLAEHQSALELIMNKYREQVLLMMEPKSFEIDVTKNADQTIEMVFMKERIAEMARIMWESAAIDDSAQIKEIEFVRRLQVENENLRELLEISGGKLPSDSSQQIAYINPNMQPVPSEKGVMLPLEGYILPKTASSIKTENINSLPGEEELKNPVDMFHSFPMEKLKKRYGAKKGRIFGNMPLPFELDGVENNSNNISGKEHIQNLEQLFKAPGSLNDKSTSERPLSPLTDTASKANSENYYLSMDPSENCFRAIISDIKPLDYNIDMNEKLFDHENVTGSQQSDKISPFFRDITNTSTKSENDDELSDVSKSSVMEYLDYIAESPAQDNLFSYDNQQTERSGENEVADISSVKSDIHETMINDEVKSHFDTSLHNLNENEGDNELDVLEFLDDVLDFESGFDENNETDSLNEQTLTNSNCIEGGADRNIEGVTNSNVNYNNKIDLKTKLIVNTDDNIQTQKLSELPSDDRTPNVVFNGDISDDDSEVTYTEEDIDQALSDFDSFLDFNDDDGNDDFE